MVIGNVIGRSEDGALVTNNVFSGAEQLLRFDITRIIANYRLGVHVGEPIGPQIRCRRSGELDRS